MRLKVTHTLDDLERDMKHIPVMAVRDMAKCVKEGARVGNSVARDFARESAGKHGKHYPKSFSSEYLGVSGGFGAYAFTAEYGPDASKRQGNMEFEFGSRNQKPHLDLARSADIIGPAFVGEVRRLPDKWFWPDA